MRTLFALATLMLLAACQAPPDTGFRHVQEEVSNRIGQPISWNRGLPQDAQAAAAQRKLLAHELSADGAVQLALLNNPSLQAEYEELGIAQADLVQAGLLKNPVFSASIRFPARPHYAVDLGIEEEFVDLLFLPARQKNAQLSLNQTQLRVANGVLLMAADVRRAYYHAVGARQLAVAEQANLDAAEAGFEAAQKLHAAGNLRDIDLDTQQAEFTQAQLAFSDAQLEAAEAREELARLLALPISSADLHLPATLPTLAASLDDEPSLQKLASAQRLDLQIADAQVDMLKQQLGIARFSALLSGGSAGAELVRDPDVKTTIGPTVSIPIPIFDQGQSAVDRAGAGVRQSAARALAVKENARTEVRLAQLRLASLRSRVLYLEQTVIPLRNRLTDESLRQYNGMYIGVFELLRSKQSALDAEHDHLLTLEKYWEARADLEKAVGGRLPAAAEAPAATQGAQK